MLPCGQRYIKPHTAQLVEWPKHWVLDTGQKMEGAGLGKGRGYPAIEPLSGGHWLKQQVITNLCS